MAEVAEKRLGTRTGDVSYLRWENSNAPFDILFIHGLGADKKWFPQQFEAHPLGAYSWIVPDLLGFGESQKPQAQDAYTMARQADALLEVLTGEKVENLVILSHSMGGPVAVSLIEQLTPEVGIRAHSLFYLEGNLDINDAYLSGKFASYTYEEYTQVFRRRLEKLKVEDPALCRETGAIGPFPFWASSVDLVRVSRSNELLSRIQRCSGIEAFFVFGESNRGRFSSEELIRTAGLPLIYVPDAGHMMYLDNPKAFWRAVLSKMPTGTGS